MDQINLLLMVIVFGIGIFLLWKFISMKLDEMKSTDSLGMMKSDIVELSRVIGDLQQSVGEKIDRNNTAMHQSMQSQLTESSKLIANVNQRLALFEETNRQVVNVADELRTIQNVLQNPKQRGVFGEYQLESVLSNVLPTKNYKMQYRFLNNDTVDAVIFLDKGQILPIDSKFSLENYNRMVTEKNKVERDKLLLKVQSDLKKRIDETSKYIRPGENTMDFAFMFVPSESLYYDLMIGDVGSGTSSRDLIEYAYRDRRVIVVSPTSFMAYLQTVLQGLRSLQIEEQAKDIQKLVGQLGRHLLSFDDFMQRLGKSLGQTVGHFNSAHKELAKVSRDASRIVGKDSSLEPLALDKPSSTDID
jgi:DNA recombination protein RmuC